MKNNKQAGLTLLETLLVLIIGATLILMGFRTYSTLKLNNDIMKVQRQAAELLSAAGKFYFSICMTDPSNAGEQYPEAKQAMDSAQNDGIDIDENLQKYLQDATSTFVNPFGSFQDGDAFKISLISVEIGDALTPLPGTTDEMDYQGQVFDSEVLWKTQVQLCDTRYYNSNDTSPDDSNPDESSPSLEAIRNSYHADNAELDSAVCNGVIVGWTRFPRNVALRANSAYSAAAQGSNGRFNKMYQWSPSMKTFYNDDRLNYLCQN